MSLIAYWCGYTWDVSRNEVRHLQDLTTSYELDSYNSQYGAKLKAQAIGLKTTYMMETGTSDINWVIASWKAGVGLNGPLYIGGKQFGSDHMQLKRVDVSNTRVDDLGRLRQATILLSFEEFEEPSMVSTVATGLSSSSSSATEISASTLDKSSYKSYSIPLATGKTVRYPQQTKKTTTGLLQKKGGGGMNR